MKKIKKTFCRYVFLCAFLLAAGVEALDPSLPDISSPDFSRDSLPGFPGTSGEVISSKGLAAQPLVGTEPLVMPTPRNTASAEMPMKAMLSSRVVSAGIAELAQALEYDAVRIYEFVRNNIEYDFQFGWIRSPERTLADRMGTDADQAVLLVELLKAAGYSDARYAEGGLEYGMTGNNGYNASSWLGVSTLDSLVWLLNHNGFNYGYSVSNNTVELYRYWVRVTVDGVPTDMDPAMKPHQTLTAESVTALSGYNRTNLLSAVGASGTSNEVYGADEEGLRDYLEGLAGSLTVAVRTNFPNSSAENIYGNRSIVPETGIGGLRGVPLFIAGYYPIQDPRIQHILYFAGTSYPYFPVSDLGCSALTFEISTNGVTGNIYKDDSVVYSGNIMYGDGTTAIRYYRATMYGGTYSYTSYTEYYPFSAGSINAMPAHFGNTDNPGLQDQRNKTLSAKISQGASSDSILRTSLHAAGESWLQQSFAVRRFFSNLYGDTGEFGHKIGVISQDAGGFSMDWRQSYFSLVTDDDAANSSHFRSPQLLASALEHGVLEQTQPGNADAVSTIKLLTLAARSNRVYKASLANYSSVRSNLTNYVASELQKIDNLIYNQSYTVILPEDGRIGHNSWEGVGYIAIASNSMGFWISDSLNGGADTLGNPYNSTLLNDLLLTSYLDPYNVIHPLSDEPVDMVTGAYTLDHNDLTMDGPMRLSLNRSYSSQSRHLDSGAGYGWTHSFNMYAKESSDPRSVLNLRSPEDAAAMAVALAVTEDLLKNEDTAKGWLTAVLAAKWAMDQLTDNAVTITLGQKAITFIKQPDGSFTPPPGMTVSLTKTNGVYVMQERNASKYTFNANNLISQIRDPDGNTVTFSYDATTTNLQNVVSSYGPQMTFSYTGGLLTGVTDNASPARTVHYQYDSNNNLTNFVDTAGKSWGIFYDDTSLPHCITALTDPEGITTIQNFYNPLGIVTQQVSATSNLWNFYISGFQSVEKDPFGNRTVYDFDELGRTLSVQNALSNRVSSSYDGQNHITNTVSEAGVTNVFVYDVNHNLLKQREAVGTPEERTTGYSYDSLNRLRFVTNALGTAEQTVTEYTYTATHHIDTITAAKGKAEERVTDLDYYGNGLLHVKTDPLRTTTFVYDVRGNPDTAASTDAGTVNLDYNEAGWLTQVTDQNSVITKYGYNALGLLTNTIHAYGTSVQASESRTYYDNRLLKTVTDARSKTTQYFWTPAYKPAGAVYPDTGSTTNLYDAADRLIATKDAKGNITSNTLDSVGRTIVRHSPLATGHFAYDPSGQITNTVVDPSGLNLWRKTAYDALNRPLNHQSSIANQQFQYDSLSRLTNRIDPASKAWKTQYDALGRIKKTFRPSENYEEYGYNALGSRTQFWNAERKPMNFGFDAQGRITAITNAIGKVTRFGYNPDGTLDWRENSKEETTQYGYDALRRLTNIVHESVWKAAFKYDANGNNVEQSSPLASTTFGYDEMNRLKVSTQSVYSVSSVVQNSYDLNGNRTNIVYPGGLSVGYFYDAENRLSGVAVSAPSAPLREFSFTYDGASRMTNIVYPNTVVSTFGYDAESRVTNYTHGAFVSHSIIRDPRGFKTTEDIYAGLVPTLTNSLHQTRTHNDADQLLSAGTDAYSYDANGCLTSSVSSAVSAGYSYDYDNRLVSVSGGSSSTSTVCLYDAGGVRIGRIADGVTNYFAVNFVDPLGLVNITFIIPGGGGNQQNFNAAPNGGNNVTTVEGHGNAGGNGIEHGNSVLNGTQAGNLVGSHIPSGDVVILYVCNAGRGSVGPDFANATGNTTIAPNGYVTPDGKVYPTVQDALNQKNQIPPSKAWTTFKPKCGG